MRQLLGVIFAIFLIPIGYAFAQEISEQTTLSGDLANDPIAQDILKKIELTKQWIADLEKRDYEKTQAQKELEEKRAVALDRLNQDLADWEALWANYTSQAAFERFVDGKPAQVQGVFWDSFEFKEMKVKAGRDALKKVIADGGSLREARAAYLEAAETKRIELIEANAQFNVKHGLAYYKQQILFDTQGKFIHNSQSFESLSQYYTDYRADPAYYAANLDDKFSYEDFGTTTPNTQCRDGFTVVHRFQSDDYVCVTYDTAEMWIRHGMGEILGKQIASIAEDNTNTPLTQCAPGFDMVYVVSTQRYSCVTSGTAEKWIDEEIAETPQIDDYVLSGEIAEPVSDLILEINLQLQTLNDELEEGYLELKAKYDKMYSDAESASKQAEKDAISNFQSNSTMTNKELSDQLIDIRKALDSLKDEILDEKEDALKDLQKQFDDDITAIRIEHVESGDYDIVWNDSLGQYEAVALN
ncbi:hypothetical protein C6988_09795 [Nitrosopumilus sp. b1]|uniref:hypothetical protein n=1 Tax=Nitrosopumilus sp. b1 TaxID=2109907 RepID=UPI0015F35769|nr:hypothetical protein [Nitrosopumilus sp. b1]KAF6242172.1 hypothetical protein C6988_09795 [Nitrosopumilus sp. b1]